VTIDIIRHDPLTADVIIPSRIPRPTTAGSTRPGEHVIIPFRIIPPNAKAKDKERAS
jgi:hypothetical protein